MKRQGFTPRESIHKRSGFTSNWPIEGTQTSQVFLGIMFFEGKGVEANYEIAGCRSHAGVDAHNPTILSLQLLTAVFFVIRCMQRAERGVLTMVEKIRGEVANKAVNMVMLTVECSQAMKDRCRQPA